MTVPQYVVLGRDEKGQPVLVGVTDTGTTDGAGNPIVSLQVDSVVTIDPGLITVGAVTVKDASAATEAAVKAPSALGAGDNALAVHDFTIGLTTDAAVTTDANGSLSAKLRGIVKILHDVWDSVLHALGVQGVGVAGTQAGGVLTVQGDPAGTAIPVSLSSDIELGSVKLLDAAGTNEAKIDPSISEGDNLLGVQAPVLGVTTDAAVVTDANGTLQQYLRGLIALFAPVLPASIGQQLMADSFPVVLASDQSTIVVGGNVGVSGTVVNQAAQTSTAAFVAVADCDLDTLNGLYVSYTIINLDLANALTWEVLAGNQADLSDAVTVKAPSSVLAGATDSYTGNPALYRYYTPFIKDTVGGSHADAKVAGVMKA